MSAAQDFIRHLMRELQHTRETELDCGQLHEMLDQFAEALAAGEDAAALLPLVQQHLELCPDCQEECEALLRVLRSHL